MNVEKLFLYGRNFAFCTFYKNAPKSISQRIKFINEIVLLPLFSYLLVIDCVLALLQI